MRNPIPDIQKVARGAPIPKRQAVVPWILILPILWGSLRLLQVGQPYLKLDIHSSASGESRIFTPTSDKVPVYSGEHQSVAPLAFGRQNISFRLPTVGSTVRWDPPDGPGVFDIHSLEIAVGFFSVPVPFEAISAARHIESIKRVDTRIRIVTTDNAFDPQLILALDSSKLAKLQIAYCAIVAALLSALLIHGRTVLERFSALEDTANALGNPSIGHRAFGIGLAVTLCLHIYELTHFMVSIDDEYAYFRTDPSGWISDGRWTAYLIERFILPRPVTPFLPTCLLCIALTLLALILARTHQITNAFWRQGALFVIFVASPFWWYIGEFYSNLPSCALGLSALALAHWDFSNLCFESTARAATSTLRAPAVRLLLQSILVAVAIGSYQSLLFLHVCMGLGAILVQATRKSSASRPNLAQTLSRLVIVSALGTAIYFAVSAGFKILIPSSTNAYVDGFWQFGALLKTPGLVIGRVLSDASAIYSGSAVYFGSSCWGWAVLLVLALATLASDRKQSTPPIWVMLVALIVLSLLVVPFTIHFISAGRSTARTMLAIPYVVWLAAALTISSRWRWIQRAAVVAASVTTFQMIVAMSEYSAGADLAQEHDRALAHALYVRIAETVPSYSPSQSIIIDFYGTATFQNSSRTVLGTAMTSSFFGWSGGQEGGRRILFLRMLGYTNVDLAPVERSKQLTVQYEKMPVWPAAGSVRFFQGNILVKLGVAPDVRRLR